jgi:hypothetical protein
VGVVEGAACFTADKDDNRACGLCVKNCGNETDNVCKAFGLNNPGARCSVSASGGGGRCGNDSNDPRQRALVCCVVSKINNAQANIPPNASTGLCPVVTNPFV